MSVYATITQKGLFRKRLPIGVILGDTLQFGCYEKDVLAPGKLTDEGFVAYDPGGIARGITVDWNPCRTDKVELRLMNPTSRREIGHFYDMVDRIGRFWNCEVMEDDEEPLPLPVPQAVRERALQGNENACRLFAEKLLREGGAFTLQSALFPITIGPPEAEELLSSGEDAYAPLLHRLQSMDVWYAQPNLYNTPQGGIMGVYVLSENVRSVFPQKPTLPMCWQMLPKEKRPVVGDWRVGLYYEGCPQNPPLVIPYDKLLPRLPPHKASRFDAVTVLIENLTRDEMLALLDAPAPGGE